MHANSRPVTSNQPDINEQLPDRVRRHASTPFQKPISAATGAAFERSIALWQAAGAPPLIVDAGCGVGLSTRRLAARHPDAFVIGIDQSADRLQRDIRWQGRMPDNFTTVRADLVDYWRLLQAHGIHPRRHYLLYPNPWPRKQHLGRRWHGHPVFPALVALGGQLECRSNWKTYVDELAIALRLLTRFDVQTEQFMPDADGPLTPFEEKYAASGHTLWRCRVALTDGRGEAGPAGPL